MKDYSKEEQNVIKEYEGSVDSKVKEFIEGIIEGKKTPKYIPVTKVSDATAEKIKELTGRDMYGKILCDKGYRLLY